MRTWLFLLVLAIGVTACGRRASQTVPEPAAAPQVSLRDGPARTYPRFDDADPHDWKRRRPSSYAVHGIDVSRWQGDIDWNKARRAGVTFAFMKATEGGDVADPKFIEHRNAAQRAGVATGAYHFYYFCRPADEQARWFIKHVPRDADALPHVLDMEWNHHSRTCTLRPSPEKVRREAHRFLDMLEAHCGQRPIVYTTPDFYKDTGIWRLGRTDFWLRSVAGHPDEVYPGSDWTFWQYSGTGLVPGIEGKVDLNLFKGTPEEWRAWRRPVITPPPAPPVPALPAAAAS